jgi:3-oxo-4-pregnene-20-carboxyl-CoA dehydrogenase beta subunit
VFIELTPEQRALEAQLRKYFAELLSAEEREALRADRHGRVFKDVVRRMGGDNWLGVGWPIEYGGRGFGPMEQLIFANEAMRAGVPLPALTLQTVGPTLQVFGSDYLKQRFLPAILKGEVHFAIGYSEPDSGTDLASLRTTAVRDGDHYVVNGQKIFTTAAHEADFIWLACRTDPNEARHKGISILIVDTKSPGFSWTPIITTDGSHHTNATYYSDVRVPADMLVGEENAGWRLITTQLNNERNMLGPAGRFAGIYERLHEWASRPGVSGRAPIEDKDVRRVLGTIFATWRINELLNWQVAASGNTIDVADAAATKVFATERYQAIGRIAEQLVFDHGDADDPATAEMIEWLDNQTKRNLHITFGGGVNEVMREMITASGLKVPKVQR